MASPERPAIPFGLTASVGTVGSQTVPLVRQTQHLRLWAGVVRAPSATATEAQLVSAVLVQAATQLAPDEAVVVDLHSPCSWGKCRGFSVGRNFLRPDSEGAPLG